MTLTWKPVYLIRVVTISCTAFMFRHRCFNTTDAATTTLGNHMSSSVLLLRTGVAAVIRTEYNKGVRVFKSELALFKDRSWISAADVFLSNEGFFEETIAQHSFPISLRNSFTSSILKSFTLNAARAISLQVPCNKHFPRDSSSVFNFRCLTCEGQETTTFQEIIKEKSILYCHTQVTIPRHYKGYK